MVLAQALHQVRHDMPEEVVILADAYPDYEARMEVARFLFNHWLSWPDETTWELEPVVNPRAAWVGWDYNAPINPDFRGAERARANEDY